MSPGAAGVLLLLAAALGGATALLLRQSRTGSTAALEARVEALSIRAGETALALQAALLRPDAARPEAAHRAPVTLDRAIARAAGFLRQRLRAGAYGLACVGSDGTPRFSHDKGHAFVAFFVAEAMAGLLDEIDRTIILTRILSEEIDGRWGFSPPGPFHDERMRAFHVDADDTAYVLRTLRLLGVNRPPDGLLPFYRLRPSRASAADH